MQRIELYSGLIALVSDEDFFEMARFRWTHKVSGRNTYAYTQDGERGGLMHRLIMRPKGPWVVDHINGNGLDNRRENLRVVSQSKNAQNQKKRLGCTSQYRGVSRYGKTEWQVKVCTNGKLAHGGIYASEEKAGRAYDNLVLRVRGPDATLNFPDLKEQQYAACFYPGLFNERGKLACPCLHCSVQRKEKRKK